MTVPALLTPEELFEISSRGRCVCGHLRVLHDEPHASCFGGEVEVSVFCGVAACDCMEFRPELYPSRRP